MKHELPTPAAWTEPLNDYLQWLQAGQRSPGTIHQHSYQLRRYAATTGLPPWAATAAGLTAYMAGLERLGASARRTKRQVLRSFYAWAELTGRSAHNPARQLPPVAPKRGIPRPAPDHSVKVARHAADPRVRLMVALAADAGLRCREIASVHRDDLIEDFAGHSLIVHGKGEHRRLVPLPGPLAAQLRDIEGHAFPGNIHGHLSAGYVSKLISRALPPGITAHQLRHRYGTRAYQLGGRDLRAVQHLLGHASVATTQLYVAVEHDAIRRAALAASA